ncbi:MAG TPA: HAMP domain-containing sensor histidine kinase [Chloroflexaceae bacterium]|nr:HAMP domain-containing sensor histidine kinase [Chloroflexaceae bacterium]
MSRRSPARLGFATLLAATVAALALLATLQYHWVGQVSAGERERLQANLSLTAQRMGEDFDRELARAYLSFQMDAQTLRAAEWERYAARFDHWDRTAPYPDLVKDVYLVEVNQIGRVGLMRYDREARGFAQVQWPHELMPVRRHIERTYRAIFADGQRAGIDISPVNRAGPSLLIPVARPWLLSDQQELGFNADLLFSDLVFPGAFGRCVRCPPELYDTPLLAHTVVVLDRDYMAGTFLPSLARRYFPAESGFDYHLGVVDQLAPSRLIYASDEGLDAGSFRTGDAAVGIFSITYDELNSLLLAGDPLPFTPPGDRPQGSRIAIGVLGRSGDESALAERGQWRLVLKHRQGSLEAAVAELRTRNLLISFGTLLLLGGSLAVLLLATRRAQRLARQQLAFASAVSHELRTPLAVICSAGENLADGLVHDPGKARQYGAVIAHEGRRLTEMVEQVLAFAAAQSGQQRYLPQRTDVAPLLEGAVQGVELQLREGGHELTLKVDPALPPARVDQAALRRAVQNLLANAMKHGGYGCRIAVEARAAAADGGAELQISVRDDGPGIDPAELPQVFEPFFRGRAASHVAGSGLGLSLVRHTAEGHGGRVSVESRLGQGARFTIHLPIQEAGDWLQEPGEAGGPQIGAPAGGPL